MYLHIIEARRGEFDGAPALFNQTPLGRIKRGDGVNMRAINHKDCTLRAPPHAFLSPHDKCVFLEIADFGDGRLEHKQKCSASITYLYRFRVRQVADARDSITASATGLASLVPANIRGGATRRKCCNTP